MSQMTIWQICCAVILALVAIQTTADGIAISATGIETPTNASLPDAMPEPVALLSGYCPSDFTYVYCVNGCYKIIKQLQNWSSAGQTCAALHPGAHLVFINSANEHNAVVAAIAATSGTEVWAGGQRVDPAINSTFVWRMPDNSSPCQSGLTMAPMIYTNWFAGQPRQPDFFPEYFPESCLNLRSEFNFEWNDGRCSNGYWFMCEIDL